MDFRFEDFVEHWCEIYKPLQHVPGERSKNKRFFLTDTDYLGMADFMTSIDSKISFCVVMEGAVEGTIKGGLDIPRETVYFFVKAEKTQSGKATRAALRKSKKHLMKFRNYIRDLQNSGMKELQNINLDEREDYHSIGPLYNGWYALYMTLEDVQQVSTCSSEDDYIESPKQILFEQ